MGIRRAGGTRAANNGTTIDHIVPASVVGGQVFGRLFTPVNAQVGVKLPLFVYIPSAGGQADKFTDGSTTLGTYCNTTPSAVPFYIYAPHFPTGNVDTSPVKLTWAAIRKGIELLRDRVDMNRISIGGYSAGASLAMKYVYSYPNYFAGFVPDSGNINRSNMCTQFPTLNDDDVGGAVIGATPRAPMMNPATILTDADCYAQWASRVKASRCKVWLNVGDAVGTDATANATAVGVAAALTALGAAVVSTGVHTSVLTTDSYVKCVHAGVDHNGMEGTSWNATNRGTTIGWVYAR